MCKLCRIACRNTVPNRRRPDTDSPAPDRPLHPFMEFPTGKATGHRSGEAESCFGGVRFIDAHQGDPAFVTVLGAQRDKGAKPNLVRWLILRSHESGGADTFIELRDSASEQSEFARLVRVLLAGGVQRIPLAR